MSTDRWRWAQRADRLRFEQLEVARRQAESWRTGLAGLTTLLGAVLIVKGRDNVSDLATPYRWVVVVLLGAALAGLVSATLTALRAASGAPSEDRLLTGEDLQQWTREEVSRVQAAIGRARAFTLAGVTLVAVAVGFSWLSPVAASDDLLVVVESGSGRFCGALVDTDQGRLIIKTADPGARHQLIPLTTIKRIKPAKSCKP
ncbi:hypothetical protein ACOZ38_13730 [Sphaerisporangium viridialbum]|uniref:hypothetical protein n=1 Tax=Sphaerisporangium viridialbum TaxID=46189 RepID=UPI003C72B89B